MSPKYLEPEMLESLKGAFAKLNETVRIEVEPSSHASQSELLDLLHDVQLARPDKIELIKLEPSATRTQLAESVRFSVSGKGFNSSGAKHDAEPRVHFRGIPGGHEFTSLVLAILNADEKGKIPDAGFLSRVQALKGPIHLKTFISLSCENCPDVVQGLNLFALASDQITHEMVDGAFAIEETESLKIQGVPATFAETAPNRWTLISSGKTNLLSLLESLESHFEKKSEAESQEPKDLGLYDVVVIGGGPAGASAAIYSVRKGLKTALITEKLGGQLLDTKGIENMISVAYTEGPQLSQGLYEHLKQYPVEILEHRRVQTIDKDTLVAVLSTRETIQAKRFIVATGAQWRRLGVEGENEHIGRGVAFCAHCDGPFYKNKKVAVVGGGNSGVEAAIDLSAIAESVVLLEYSDSLKADASLVEKLKALPNVQIHLKAESQKVQGDGNKVVGLQWRDRDTKELNDLTVDGVFVQIGLKPNTQFLEGVVELNRYGEIVVDEKGRTSVPGIYAAGDATTIPFKQIIMAMGDGAKVALSAFDDRMRAS